MFRNTFQSGFLSILYAIGSKPLQIWRKNINNGYVKRITDFEMQSSVIEICGANVSTCFLSCISKNISHSKFKLSTIRMSKDVSELLIINRTQELNLSFVLFL